MNEHDQTRYARQQRRVHVQISVRKRRRDGVKRMGWGVLREVRGGGGASLAENGQATSLMAERLAPGASSLSPSPAQRNLQASPDKTPSSCAVPDREEDSTKCSWQLGRFFTLEGILSHASEHCSIPSLPRQRSRVLTEGGCCLCISGYARQFSAYLILGSYELDEQPLSERTARVRARRTTCSNSCRWIIWHDMKVPF